MTKFDKKMTTKTYFLSKNKTFGLKKAKFWEQLAILANYWPFTNVLLDVATNIKLINMTTFWNSFVGINIFQSVPFVENHAMTDSSPATVEFTAQVKFQPILAKLSLVVKVIMMILVMLLMFGRREPLFCPPMKS